MDVRNLFPLDDNKESPAIWIHVQEYILHKYIKKYMHLFKGRDTKSYTSSLLPTFIKAPSSSLEIWNLEWKVLFFGNRKFPIPYHLRYRLYSLPKVHHSWFLFDLFINLVIVINCITFLRLIINFSPFAPFFFFLFFSKSTKM